jgi:hypothetical protein
MEACQRVAAMNVHRIISRAAAVDTPADSKKRSARNRAARGASDGHARDLQ